MLRGKRGERQKIILECLIRFIFTLLDLNENKSTLRRQTEETQQDNGHLLVSIHYFLVTYKRDTYQDIVFFLKKHFITLQYPIHFVLLSIRLTALVFTKKSLSE